MMWRPLLLVTSFVAVISSAYADNPWQTEVANRQTQSQHGGVGLVQMPTARMSPDGEFAIQYAQTDPYDRVSFTTQILPNLEFVFRYNSLNNHLYGAKEFSGNLTYKDRAFDIKLGLVDESDWLPAISVGARDFLGTGLFSSEYLVASKRYYNWDFTAGLMWGNIGTRQDVGNPFSIFSNRFETRSNTTSGKGGEVESNDWFKGKHAALFAGASYQFSNQPIWLVAEYDANDYQQEPKGSRFVQNSPVNLGVRYRYNNWLDLGVSYERGDLLSFSIALRSNFMRKDMGVAKFDPPVQPPISDTQAVLTQQMQQIQQPALVSTPEQLPTELRQSIQALQDQLQATGVGLYALSLQEEGKTLRIDMHNKRHLDSSRAIGRAARVLLAHSDESILQFQFNLRSADNVLIESVSLMRHQLAQTMQHQLDPTVISRYARRVAQETTHDDNKPRRLANDVAAHSAEPVNLITSEQQIVKQAQQGIQETTHNHSERQLASVAASANAAQSTEPVNPIKEQRIVTQRYPYYTASIAPALRHNIGGPDDFFQYQLMLQAPLELKLMPGLSLSTLLTLNVYDTFDKIKLESDSVLPHVRSDIKHYLQQQGLVSLTSLQADYTTHLATNWYGRLSAGWFEEMFGGVGGEILFAPAGKRWALGFDSYYAKQRDYEQRLSFRDYDVLTGHVTWYHQWPWMQIESQVKVGQYLAGDRGYTVDVSRQFDNGVRIGGFFTKTNVSAQEFGEGSFDKGIYIRMPLDFFTTRYSKNSMGMMWRPLTRDGGAILGQNKRLYPMVKDERADALFDGASQLRQ